MPASVMITIMPSAFRYTALPRKRPCCKMQDKKKQNKTAQKTLFDIMKNDLLLDKMDEWSKVS